MSTLVFLSIVTRSKIPIFVLKQRSNPADSSANRACLLHPDKLVSELSPAWPVSSRATRCVRPLSCTRSTQLCKWSACFPRAFGTSGCVATSKFLVRTLAVKEWKAPCVSSSNTSSRQLSNFLRWQDGRSEWMTRTIWFKCCRKHVRLGNWVQTSLRLNTLIPFMVPYQRRHYVWGLNFSRKIQVWVLSILIQFSFVGFACTRTETKQATRHERDVDEGNWHNFEIFKSTIFIFEKFSPKRNWWNTPDFHQV